MNAPEHYAEAERLLQLAGDGRALATDDGVPQAAPELIAEAHVHATLALAAALALPNDASHQWRQAVAAVPVQR